MELVDTHCHLDEHDFQVELPEIIKRANDVGVTQMVVIGTTLASSRKVVEIAERFAGLFPVVGIHPNYAATAEPGDWDAIRELARNPRVVGLGETGLDRYWDHTPIEVQLDYFRRHLELSRETGLPFVIHCREADADVLAELQRDSLIGPLNGLMHSFAGTSEMARDCLELGLLLSFSGMVTYKKNDALLDVARRTPLDRILVETDSPYLSPTPLRGKRNEPANVRYTLGCIADARGITREDLASATTGNARRIFKLPIPN